MKLTDEQRALLRELAEADEIEESSDNSPWRPVKHEVLLLFDSQYRYRAKPRPLKLWACPECIRSAEEKRAYLHGIVVHTIPTPICLAHQCDLVLMHEATNDETE